jgi:NADH dehydrogenase
MAAAENLARAIGGQPQVPFRYHSLGNSISLGRLGGAVEIGGLVVNGLTGCLAWRAIHLAKVPGFRNQLATLLDWGVSYVSTQDTARLDTEPVIVDIEAVADESRAQLRPSPRGRAA